MGVGCSSIHHLQDNDYLKKLSSTVTISQYDPFWNQLFSNSLPYYNNRASTLHLQEVTHLYCKSLFANNQQTGNFTSLVKVFLSRSAELQSSAECGDKIFLWQTQNALYIIRHLCLFLVENMTEDKIIEQFEACSLDDRKKELANGFPLKSFSNALDGLLIKQFIFTLMNITTNVTVTQCTYDIHCEAISCLIILLSVQMLVPSASYHGLLHNVFFNSFDTTQINSFVHSLFQHYIEQRVIPRNDKEDLGGSIVLGLAATVASGIRSVFQSHSGEDSKDTMSQIKTVFLAHQSALLLLILINHQPKDSSKETKNSFKEAVCSFRHIQGRQKGIVGQAQNVKLTPSFHINLSRLYKTLYSTQSLESSTLLLYFLLQENLDVKAFIFSKADIDTLVLPILHILYIAPAQNSHHIYMALIILLMLTEDDHFNKGIHEIKLTVVPWYTDKILSDVSLGDLMILVILRVIQFNMYQLRDRYLHTNCLAALANMSSQFRSIHSYPSQKFFELISALTKRHKLYKQKLSSTFSTNVSEQENQTTVSVTDRNYNEEIQVLEEVLRMLLEIVNSCFSCGIHRQNSNLVYALLQKRKTINELKACPAFQDILQNIETIINFFSEKIDQMNREALTIEDVRQLIDNTIMQLPSHYLQKFPELKFRYIEEESPEDFFVPYVWSLVFNKSGIYWNPGCVQLFSLEQ